METTIKKLGLEDYKITEFIQNYLSKLSKNNLDEFRTITGRLNKLIREDYIKNIEKQLKETASKQDNLLDVVLVNNKVIMIYEEFNNVKKFLIERFSYDDFPIIGQFDGFIEPVCNLNEDIDKVYDILAITYKNHLLYNLEDSMYETYGYENLSSYKTLKMRFKSFDGNEDDKLTMENDYLQSIHFDITVDTLYNQFIESFEKNFDSYDVRPYHFDEMENRNNLTLLFNKELLITNKSNTVKTFGFKHFSKKEINNAVKLYDNVVYFILIGIKDFEEQPLAILNISDYYLVKGDEIKKQDIKGKMINYFDCHYLYNENKSYFKDLLLSYLNDYIKEKEIELIILNLMDKYKDKLIEFDDVKKSINNAYVLDLENQDEFLKRITFIG